jgi:aminopeptidase-like protein
MSSFPLHIGFDADALARDLSQLIAELYPICRSITGV